MLIDCDDCVLQGSAACADCLVTHLVEPLQGAVVFDVAEERALRVLHAGGLAPASRYASRSPGRRSAEAG